MFWIITFYPFYKVGCNNNPQTTIFIFLTCFLPPRSIEKVAAGSVGVNIAPRRRAVVKVNDTGGGGEMNRVIKEKITVAMIPIMNVLITTPTVAIDKIVPKYCLTSRIFRCMPSLNNITISAISTINNVISCMSSTTYNGSCVSVLIAARKMPVKINGIVLGKLFLSANRPAKTPATIIINKAKVTSVSDIGNFLKYYFSTL